MFTRRQPERRVVTRIRWLGNLALMCVACAVTPGAAHAQNVFWTDLDTKSIFRADLGAGTRTTIFQKTTGIGAPGLAFDAPTRQLYWLDDGSIFQSNIDGSQIGIQKYTDALVVNPSAIALDLFGRLGGLGPKIYLGGGQIFYHVNPDGTDFSRFFSFNDDPEVESLAIDFEQQRFYWSTHAS